MLIGNTLALRTVLLMCVCVYVCVCVSEVLNSVAFWLATSLMSWVQFLTGAGIFLFAIMFRPGLCLTHPAGTVTYF
jgi:hypothetical protein